MKSIIQNLEQWWDRKPRLAALAAFCLLSVVAYYPRAFYPLDLPSDGLPHYDTGQYFWNFWWTYQQLTTCGSLYTTDFLFYPEGVELTFHSLHLFNTLFVLPFQAIGIPALGYNLVFLAAAIFTGWGVYLLGLDLGLGRRAGWVAGALVLLAPYRFGQMIHFNLFNTVAIPFYLLWIRRGLMQGGWKCLILWGLWLFLAANSSWYYLLFLLVLSPCWALYVVREEKLAGSWKRLVGRTAAAAAIFSLLFLPQLLAILQHYQPDAYQRPMEVATYWSAPLANFFLPPVVVERLIVSDPGAFPYQYARGAYASFPGLVVWILTIGLLFRFRTARGKFWLVIAVVGLVLALGPALKILRPVIFGGENRYVVLLPGYFLQDLPLIGAARVPARWSLLFQFGLIFFIASNYARLEAQYRRWVKWPCWLLAGAIVLAALVENWPGPLPHSSLHPPAVLQQLVAERPQRPVLHLPFGGPDLGGYYMYLQTFTGLPMCNGYTSFRSDPGESIEHSLIEPLEGRSGQVDWEAVSAELQQQGIGWVIFHPRSFERLDRLHWILSAMEQQPDVQLYAQTPDMIILRIDKAESGRIEGTTAGSSPLPEL